MRGTIQQCLSVWALKVTTLTSRLEFNVIFNIKTQKQLVLSNEISVFSLSAVSSEVVLQGTQYIYIYIYLYNSRLLLVSESNGPTVCLMIHFVIPLCPAVK